MSNYYSNVYQKRLNRYGLDYQSRIQGQREKDFEAYLYKTIYRVDFDFDGTMHPGSLEQSAQDHSETQCYLLTRRELVIPNGTVLFIENKNGDKAPWMVWWLEHLEASGYNRYVVLKMTHELTWIYEEEKTTQWGYFFGPGQSAMSSTNQASGANAIYRENNNAYRFVTSFNESLIRGSYFEVIYKGLAQAYVIKEFDVSSTPGVAYITVDPVPLRDLTKAKVCPVHDSTEETFWLTGGAQ